jgi:hypothetical protein
LNQALDVLSKESGGREEQAQELVETNCNSQVLSEQGKRELEALEKLGSDTARGHTIHVL